jgi:hypothetical protein
MNIAKKCIAATLIATAAFGVSTSASAHSGGAIAAIALGGMVVGSALATGPRYAPAPAYYGEPVYYAPRPVYYAPPAYYYPAPVYYRSGYRPYYGHGYYR